MKRNSSDDDLRALERRAAQGDPAAKRRLVAMRLRMGLPSGVSWRGSLRLYREAQRLHRGRFFQVWTNEEERIQVRETFHDYTIEDLRTNQSRGMGDGVDMYTTRDGRSIHPGTIEFNRLMAREVRDNARELREAYFPETVETDEDPRAELQAVVDRLSRERVTELLENASIQVRDEDSDEELREALVVNVEDGTIRLADLE